MLRNNKRVRGKSSGTHNRIAIGSDHGGFALKEELVYYLKTAGFEIADFGTHNKEPCDYPLIGYKVARAISSGEFERGILVCKSGIGQSIVANKLPDVRAALCYSREAAVLSRRHNNANILVLGSLFTDRKQVKDIVSAWLAADFEGGRHKRRVEQIKRIERKEIVRG